MLKLLLLLLKRELAIDEFYINKGLNAYAGSSGLPTGSREICEKDAEKLQKTCEKVSGKLLESCRKVSGNF